MDAPDTEFADLVQRGLKYAITQAASVPISDELVREIGNRLHAKVLDGDPAAVLLWHQICGRAAEHIRQEFLALAGTGALADDQ